jgi:hypothetical protein
MGSSLFGGGTSSVNSTTNSNQNTNYNTNQAQNQAQNTAQNQAQNTAGTSDPTAWQMPYLAQGLNTASGLLNGAPSYSPLSYTPLISPQFAANAGALDQAAQANANRFGDMVNTGAGLLPAFNRASGAAGSVLSSATTDPTQGNIAAAGSYANNPYMAGMIRAAQAPIERQLNEVSIPNLNIGAGGTGNTDSSRSAMMEAILRRNAGIDESNVAANLQGNAYNSGLNLAEQARMGNMGAAINAGGLFSNVGNSGSNLVTAGNNGQISDLNVPIQVDQMYQQDQQNQNNVNYQNANAGAQFPWQQLNNFWGIAGHPLGTNTTGSSTGSSTGSALGSATGNTSGTSQSTGTNLTNGTQTQPGPGVLGGLLGTATGIGSLFSGGGLLSSGGALAGVLPFLSDRRAKTDIKQVGKLDNGLPVYVFRYRGDNTPQIGLMADDVEKVNPRAVVTGPNGLKMVHYDQAVE